MLGTTPASILSNEYWADLDASTFRVRGKNYIDDKIKVVPAPSIFKLIAIDVRTRFDALSAPSSDDNGHVDVSIS
jgi:Protein ENHANCED DISEASE RESISTANCE 2, C-terminal